MKKDDPKIVCILYIGKKYPLLPPQRSDFKLDRGMTIQMYTSGLCMGSMLSLVNLGSVILQGAINTFGEPIVWAIMVIPLIYRLHTHPVMKLPNNEVE